jgi:CHAT domain-containing protein/tetratricopeptide (TPR) repeat protein
MSIYCAPRGTQPARRVRASVSRLYVLLGAVLQLSLNSVANAALAASPHCAESIANKPHFQERLATPGVTPAETRVTVSPGREWLIEARERGNDSIVEVLDPTGHILAQADHPERRSGTRRLIVSVRVADSLTVRATGKEHGAVTGTVDILVYELSALSSDSACVSAYRSLAAADADYAMGQQISLGRRSAATGPAGGAAGPPSAATGQTSAATQQTSTATMRARDVYQRAAREYLAAETLLDNPTDAGLRGEIALALAGIWYFDLQDWRVSADWANTAANLLDHREPYRHARAEALAAAAWIEMATDSAPHVVGGGPELGPKELFQKARRTLRKLFAFHVARQEPYDAALQINNIGVAYSYEVRFRECIVTERAASQMFAKLREAPRQALARQNLAMCYWGLGHLPEALDAFNHALDSMKPDPYPQLYLLTLSNTALINYALGRLDESLRLHGRSLELAIRTQNPREEAQSLYGIGITYYALGDRELAREYLERSLTIRTPALDARGRRASLRSLATVYAESGDYGKAMEFDREALASAPAPTTRARSRIRLAAHMALDGDPDGALKDLSDLIESGTVSDPLIQAQARLERAVIERRGGDYHAALRDLDVAIPIIGSLGSVSDGFAADLERARALRLTGDGAAALIAVDKALARSEAIRTQTANPELRAQIQMPLRPAYDLKLDLLWGEFELAEKLGDEGEATRIAGIAFRSADAARARSFADIAAQEYSSRVRRDFTAEFARRDALYLRLAGLRFGLESRLDRSGSADPRAKELQSEIAGFQREVDTLNSAIATRTAVKKEGRADGKGISPDAVGLSSAAGVTPVPHDVAIIAYWLGAEFAYVWAVTPAGIHWVRLEAPDRITAAAREFHDSLGRLIDIPRERRMETGSDLYAKIVEPIYQWVELYKRWFFIPDAALNFVPFAALRGGAKPDLPYIVAGHDVALAPAAWMLLSVRGRMNASRAPSRILLVSDPVYEASDPRIRVATAPDTASGAATSATATTNAASVYSERIYRRIPGTAREASAIEAEFAPNQVDALQGFDASRDRLLKLDWSGYRFIHIATHGYSDARIPQLSAAVLSSYDERGERIAGALRAADISSMTLKADVAVFSGCETALGKEVLDEGMVGITYATLARGAGAVVSSLWQVPDEISANLMTEFYRHLISDSMSPATALSTSMRSILDRNASADPALWAAFQVSVVSLAQHSSPMERVAKEAAPY